MWFRNELSSLAGVSLYRVLFEGIKWTAERLSAVKYSPARQGKINCPFADCWCSTERKWLFAAICSLPTAVHCALNATSSPGELRLAKKRPVMIWVACGFVACCLRDNNFVGGRACWLKSIKWTKADPFLKIHILVFQNVTVRNFTDNY